MSRDYVIIRGAREHNLKNIDVEIPKNSLVVVTGLSGSGKSSLAFDTIYAEGQRRYVESLSAYARQFLGQMDKPDVDYIEGLSPAISIDQKAGSKNPRSTVGTITEIYDYLRLMFARVGRPHCPNCGDPIAQQSIEHMVDRILSYPQGSKLQILAPLVRGRKGEYQKTFNDIRKDGYVRVRVDGEIRELQEEIVLDKNKKHTIEVVVDRLVVKEGLERRLADSLETSLNLSGGLVIVHLLEGEEQIFSQNFACTDCGFSFEELTPRMFSFNSPYGACLRCSGLGFKLEVDPDLVINKALSLREGAIIPWNRTKHYTYYQQLLESVCEHYHIDPDLPTKDLDSKDIDFLLRGSGNEKIHFSYAATSGRQHNYYAVFPGIIPYLERRYRESTSEYVREEITRYMSSRPCPECQGTRLKKESLSVLVGGKNISQVTSFSVSQCLEFFEGLELSEKEKMIARLILKEIRERLHFLVNVGLNYLSLNRKAGTLSGGEAQRIRLATQIGSGLTGVLYILDEPSIGLHQRDNLKLLNTLKNLRDLGNTLIVVEHDEETIWSADYVIDIGPGAGDLGGEVVAAGTVDEILKKPRSITGQYLSGKKEIPLPSRRRETGEKWLQIKGAGEYNLKDLDVEIPLGVFICVTGVSGSGKSTLVNEILYKKLAQELHRAKSKPGKHKQVLGIEHLDKVIEIDQSPIGRTPRSNPATYTGAFTYIRELFSQVPDAKVRGYNQGRFSFNLRGGRCESCKGDGIIKIEMHFLPDVYVPCEVCKGKRYNRETLEVTYKGKNIAQVLDMTVAESLDFFQAIPKIKRKLQVLYDVGLGYVKLGQPATTLSGGEAQRVKLSSELSRRSNGKTLYILDEPTTGLHIDDIKKLLSILNRLVDAGDTVMVIEHNLDVIKSSDYIIDLGPEGGDQGGWVTAKGTPEEVAQELESYTGQYLKSIVDGEQGQKMESAAIPCKEIQ
ncbi:excinuclease ABC subunit UvrA [Candidatus Contubernalis alkaliaceticus]|uniref:excinuclease ABC subunit UvrA n=1 Tax=Candidatus Contubernalis alkaliaceticus TaxID=338645 RepID=UPI001F4BF80F|nr:excinuclease ABC subunit UvrA [Candidatus Contubernalis alkalaceticus]UNC90781.1 excinuclease ABC subunit UvrA [Candidatus Contubernalis alkalaceticus]